MKPGVAKATGIFALVAVGGGSLSSCGERREKQSLTVGSGRESSSQVDRQFGREFGEAFSADPNSEPRNVTEGDLPPVSMTTEPVVVD